MSLITLTISAAIVSQTVPPEISKWEDDVAELIERDHTEAIPNDAIVFYGSSSIRLWETIAEDMAPWPIVQRGYGGARFSDGGHYAARVLKNHVKTARAIVMFFANDISGNAELDVPPSVVAERASRILSTIRNENAELPVFFIEVTPTSSRWKHWSKIATAGRSIEAMTSGDPNAHFIATAGAFLNDDGRPRDELFVDDQLHLNDAGYDLWSALIKARLHQELGPALPVQVTRWFDDVERFSESNLTAPDDAVLFYGSSSIRLWETIHEDFAPWPVIQRGYGGAALADAAHYVGRVVEPHRLRALVLFVGNDIYSLGRAADTAVRDFEQLLARVRSVRPELPVVWIDVRPVLSKHDQWIEVERLNELVHAVCERDRFAGWVSPNAVFWTDAGGLRDEYFAADRVHLNKSGYAAWSGAVREQLVEILTERERC